MSGRLFTLDRPDEQQSVSMEIPHGCGPGELLRPYLGEEADLLYFPVGTFGADLPGDAPFAVETAEPCPACGKYVRAWFQWRRRLYFT